MVMIGSHLIDSTLVGETNFNLKTPYPTSFGHPLLRYNSEFKVLSLLFQNVCFFKANWTSDGQMVALGDLNEALLCVKLCAVQGEYYDKTHKALLSVAKPTYVSLRVLNYKITRVNSEFLPTPAEIPGSFLTQLPKIEDVYRYKLR